MDVFRAVVGSRESLGLDIKARRMSMDFSARLSDALHKVSQPCLGSHGAPIFLLSAGWRSGSTLLQRMLMEFNDDIVIWGEPFDHSNIYDNMMNQFRCFTTSWPPQRFFLSSLTDAKLSDKWIANLYPDIEYLLGAHRAFFDALFGIQARAAGRRNWGLKEVRLTIEHASYFRALYPDCKIVLLYRRPEDAYLSYRAKGGAWFRRWPNELVATPFAFGRQWAEITQGFIDGYERHGALVLRYECLDDPTEVLRLQNYLGWRVPRASELPNRNIGGGGKTTGVLPWADRVLLDLGTGRTRENAGY